MAGRQWRMSKPCGQRPLQSSVYGLRTPSHQSVLLWRLFLGTGSSDMGCRQLCFSVVSIASFCFLSSVSAAVEISKNDGLNAITQEQKSVVQSLICETIHPVDPPKGKAPRNCNDFCAEKDEVCTGVQSHQGPPPSCEDEMYRSYGSCRCCTVRP